MPQAGLRDLPQRRPEASRNWPNARHSTAAPQGAARIAMMAATESSGPATREKPGLGTAPSSRCEARAFHDRGSEYLAALAARRLPQVAFG